MARAAFALVAFVIASAVMTGRADADDRRTRVGVAASVATKVAPDDVQAVIGAFQRDLEATYLVTVVPGLGAAPPASCASDAACLGDLSSRLGVDRLVFLVLTGVGRKVRIDVTVLDADRHVAHGQPTIIDLGASDLDRSLADYTHGLLPGVPPKPIAPIESSPPPPPTGLVAIGSATPIDQEPRVHKRAAYLSAGAAVVLLVGGLVAGNAASSAFDEYKTTMSPARYDLLRDRVSRDSKIANGLFIAGGLAVAGSAALFVIKF